MKRRRTIRLVLDTSALRAYQAGSDSVGETLVEVDENGVCFGIPVGVLAAAVNDVDMPWLNLITAHEAFVPVEFGFDRWRPLGAVLSLTKRGDAAEACLTALDENCDVLTAEPWLYTWLGDDAPIIEI